MEIYRFLVNGKKERREVDFFTPISRSMMEMLCLIEESCAGYVAAGQMYMICALKSPFVTKLHSRLGRRRGPVEHTK